METSDRPVVLKMFSPRGDPRDGRKGLVAERVIEFFPECDEK
jgi:hypothetical protein